MKKILFWGIGFLFISACSVNPSAKQDVHFYNFKEINQDSVKEMVELDSVPIHIKVPNKFGPLNIDKAIKEMKYVPLETNSSSIIGRITKLEIHKNRIYILDNSFAQSVFIFDMNGHHLHTISKKGQGPEEYIGIRDFCFHGDTLVIHDGFGAKLLFFNEMGDYLFKRKTGFHFRSIRSFPNGDYFIVTRNAQNSFLSEIDNYSVLIGKPDSIVKYKGFKNNLFLEQFENTISNPIVEYNGNFLFSPLLSNYIYQVNSDGSYFPKYAISFKHGLPQDYYEKTSAKDFDNYIKKNNYSYFMGKFFENDDHLFFRFDPPGNFYGYVVFNKNSSSVICYDGTISPENKFWRFSEPEYAYNNYFIGFIEPVSILKKKKELLHNSLISPENKSALESISENDNPILIFIHLNK